MVPAFLSNMPSRSFLSANSYANMCANRCGVTSQSADNLRRSPRLIAKAKGNDLVRSVLNIPIYIPKQLGVAADTYAPADRVRDPATIKTYMLRGEQMQRFVGRDATLARTINIACIYMYLCENPSLLRHHTVFRDVVRNKRDEFLKSLDEQSVKYVGDAEFNRVVNIVRRIFSLISPML